jgi:hypothetical protein
MSGDPSDRRRRVMLAQGLAALGCFIAVHGAHAAISPGRSGPEAGAPAKAAYAAHPARR